MKYGPVTVSLNIETIPYLPDLPGYTVGVLSSDIRLHLMLILHFGCPWNVVQLLQTVQGYPLKFSTKTFHYERRHVMSHYYFGETLFKKINT